MLRKSVYPYEYMDEWEKSNEYSLSEKEEFYSNLNMKDTDYIQGKRVCKDFEIEHLGEYQDLYFKIDTLFFAEVFKGCRKLCLEIYQLDSAKCFQRPC